MDAISCVSLWLKGITLGCLISHSAINHLFSWEYMYQIYIIKLITLHSETIRIIFLALKQWTLSLRIWIASIDGSMFH